MSNIYKFRKYFVTKILHTILISVLGVLVSLFTSINTSAMEHNLIFNTYIHYKKNILIDYPILK